MRYKIILICFTFSFLLFIVIFGRFCFYANTYGIKREINIIENKIKNSNKVIRNKEKAISNIKEKNSDKIEELDIWLEEEKRLKINSKK